MAKKRKNPVEELWRRITEDYDFPKRMADFRERNGIPAKGFASVMDVYNARNSDGTSVLMALQAFNHEVISEYGFGDYLEELEPPMTLYVALNEVEHFTNFPHLTESFGITVADGAEIIQAIDELRQYEQECFYPGKLGIDAHFDIKKRAIIHSLEKSAVLIIKPHASLQDLQNIHKHFTAWQKILEIRDKKDQNIFGTRVRQRSKANLHKLVHEAYRDGVIKSDGYRTEAYKGAWPPPYFDLAFLNTENIKKILGRERKRRLAKKKKSKGE